MPPTTRNDGAPRMTSRQRREVKEIARRAKSMRMRKPKPREIAMGLFMRLMMLGAIVFVIALVVTLVMNWLE